VVSIEEPGKWRTPSHGRGLLKPFEAGNKLGGRRGTVYTETQRLAREHSVDALMTLVERLNDRDGRVAIAAVIAILERAWGKVREARPEDEQPSPRIDLSVLTDTELQLLVRLVESDRWRPASTDGPFDTPQIIEATANSDAAPIAEREPKKRGRSAAT
jgi:hypothetical protein